jgi:hypothetical protein
MTAGDNPRQVIAGVLDTLRQSRAMLLDPSPRNIDRCRAALASCIDAIKPIVEADCAGWSSRELEESLLLMRGELSAIMRLLDSAAVFRRNMLKVVSDATPRNVIAIDANPHKVRHVHVLG